MTVKELEEILTGIEDKSTKVVSSYYNTAINGYYFTEKDGNGRHALVLTELCVQPRT